VPIFSPTFKAEKRRRSANIQKGGGRGNYGGSKRASSHLSTKRSIPAPLLLVSKKRPKKGKEGARSHPTGHSPSKKGARSPSKEEENAARGRESCYELAKRCRNALRDYRRGKREKRARAPERASLGALLASLGAPEKRLQQKKEESPTPTEERFTPPGKRPAPSRGKKQKTKKEESSDENSGA